MSNKYSTQSLPDDLLIDLFSHRPSDYLDGVINVQPAKKTVFKRQTDGVALLSTLELLPTEVLWMILNTLDFGTLTNLSRASTCAMAIVHALPAYDQMMRFAPGVLSALGETGTIRHHTAASLLKVLYKERCARCSKYGTYVNLLTLERCCDQCSCFDLSFCVAPKPALCSLLGIKISHLKNLPILHTLRGNFKVADGLPTSRNQRLRVVSVAEAVAIAKKVYKLDESKHWEFRHGTPNLMTERDLESSRLAYSFLGWSEGHVLSKDTANHRLRKDLSKTYCGSLASVFCPSITKEGYIQEGLWCLGCNYAYCRQTGDIGTSEEKAEFTYSMRRTTMRSETHAVRFHCYSRRGLLDHIQKCPGALEMLPKLRLKQNQGRCEAEWETKQRHR